MSTLDTQRTEESPTSSLDTQEPARPEERSGHGGHSRWMMIACCVPMLALAIVLVATGVASAGFIFAAVACTAMMAIMMAGMSGGRGSAG